MESEENGRTIALLWNRSSGWSDSDETRRKVEEILSAKTGRVDVYEVERGRNVPEQTKAIVQQAPEILVAAGGDGTINAAASALIDKPTALAVIPAGTLNHFARDLQLPIDAEQAARAVADGKCLRVDAAEVNGRVFINNSVLGFFPNYRRTREAAERRGWAQSRIGRFFAGMGAVLSVFWRLPHVTVSIDVEGRTQTLRTPFVLVGNNEHRMEGFALGSRDRLDTGKLWVYVLPQCTRWQFLLLIFRLIFGRVPRESVFQIYSASEVTIHSKRPRIGVGIDGEMVSMTPPLRYRSLPAALRVIAPDANADTCDGAEQ
jgi:diacylglycerol kinase family enzyme